jgi:hypothetical protein
MIKVTADLTPKQKKKVSTWIRPETYPAQDSASRKNHYTEITKPISDHVFGNKTRLKLPNNIVHSSSKPNKDVLDYLERYTSYETSPDRYKQGIAHHLSDSDKKRSLKIGKILEAQKAPVKIKQAYINDPYRSASKSHLDTTISRHPYDVAGMSTDRGWDSCLDMDKGVYKKDLHHEIENGTHVAYLHHKTDPSISHPVARVALRPFEHPGHKTILRADLKVYGTSNPEFHKNVKDWAEHVFPAKPNVIYKRNPSVYNDTDENKQSTPDHILNHTDNKELFKHNSLERIEGAADDNLLKNHPIKYEDVEHVLPNLHHQRHVSTLGHITDNTVKEDLPKLAHHANPVVRHDVIDRWQDLPRESKQHILNDSNPKIQSRLKMKRIVP